MNPAKRLFDAFHHLLCIADLRRRILFTLALLAIYRLGGVITTPGINIDQWQEFLHRQSGSLFGLFDVFAGGNVTRLSVFALGIMPWISASIILQLLAVIVPAVEKLQKEGELGRRRITQWTRYLAVVLGVAQSATIAAGLQSMQGGVVANPGFGFVLMTVVSLTAGTALIMWLGEQITERGIGNGMSLIVFTGIVVHIPRAAASLYTSAFVTQDWGPLTLLVFLTLVLAMVAFTVFVEMGERRIPIQYAKGNAGRRVAGGQTTHMPLKVNAGGVMPVIFASSILAFPENLSSLRFVKNNPWLTDALSIIRHGEPLYILLFFMLILFFSFFYGSIILNPAEAADNMRRLGGFIPGTRPGRATSDRLDGILTRLTFAGAAYLSILCLIPEMIASGIHLQHLPLIGDWIDRHFPLFILQGLNVQFPFGGTSLLIVVGVARDTMQQIEARMIMRHYEGFTPRANRLRRR